MAVRDTCGDMITRARMKTDLFRWAVGASIALTVLVIAGFLLFRKEEDFARVMATPQDCLRAFDDAACRKLMKQALAIHYRRAPHRWSNGGETDRSAAPRHRDRQPDIRWSG